MLEKLEPREVFYWFEKLTKIPRCSYNEEEVSEFLMNFAKERNLWCHKDDEKNVIIKKPATKGRENAPTVILQGHMDMVCEKIDSSNHDFTCDPIPLVIDGDWLKTDGTTLGADDGIAVAYNLAILDSDEIEHGPLEVLFTTAEEMAMEGAMAVTDEFLTGDYLFNIDGEVEGDLLVGCAGGLTITSTRKIEREKAKDLDFYTLEIKSLVGGHSGQEIHKTRANSLKMLARVLSADKNIEIVSIEGGSKHNAIPVSAKAIFAVKDGIKDIEEAICVLKKEHEVSDPNMEINVSKTDKKEEIWTKETKEDILDFLVAIPDGVQYMDQTFHDLVQTSLSNGILREENDKISLVTLLRSSVKSAENEIYERFKTIAKAFKFETEDDGGYPAWEYDPKSKLKDLAIEVYKEQYGEDPSVKTIHCGLECGILKRPLKDTDMLTFGPDMIDIHTPKERLNIKSTERVWKFTKTLLDRLSR